MYIYTITFACGHISECMCTASLAPNANMCFNACVVILVRVSFFYVWQGAHCLCTLRNTKRVHSPTYQMNACCNSPLLRASARHSDSEGTPSDRASSL